MQARPGMAEFLQPAAHCAAGKDNEPLMRALAKLVAINSPDLVWNPRVGKTGKEVNSAVLC